MKMTKNTYSEEIVLKASEETTAIIFYIWNKSNIKNPKIYSTILKPTNIYLFEKCLLSTQKNNLNVLESWQFVQ